MVWKSHLFKNFPEFAVVHTGEGFGIVNKAVVDVSLWTGGKRENSEPFNSFLCPNP